MCVCVCVCVGSTVIYARKEVWMHLSAISHCHFKTTCWEHCYSSVKGGLGKGTERCGAVQAGAIHLTASGQAAGHW